MLWVRTIVTSLKLHKSMSSEMVRPCTQVAASLNRRTKQVDLQSGHEGDKEVICGKKCCEISWCA